MLLVKFLSPGFYLISYLLSTKPWGNLKRTRVCGGKNDPNYFLTRRKSSDSWVEMRGRMRVSYNSTSYPTI